MFVQYDPILNFKLSFVHYSFSGYSLPRNPEKGNTKTTAVLAGYLPAMLYVMLRCDYLSQVDGGVVLYREGKSTAYWDSFLGWDF
jgi:hypothetical protein